MRDLGTIVPKKCVPFDNKGKCFYKKNYGTKWSFRVKVEPIVASSDSRPEQIGPLSVI